MRVQDLMPVFARTAGTDRERGAEPSAGGEGADFEEALADLGAGSPAGAGAPPPAGAPDAADPAASAEAAPATAAEPEGEAAAPAVAVEAAAEPALAEPDAGRGANADPAEAELVDPLASLLLEVHVLFPPLSRGAGAAVPPLAATGSEAAKPHAAIPAPATPAPAAPAASAAPASAPPAPAAIAAPALAGGTAIDPPAVPEAAGPSREALPLESPAETRDDRAAEPDAAEDGAARPVPTSQAAPAAPTSQPASAPDPGLGLVAEEGAVPGWRLEVDGGRAAPGSAPAASPSLHPAPEALASQIAVGVAGAGSDSVEIRLDPPELGKVQILLEQHDDTLRVVVIAERPETQDFLRRNGESLVRELTQAGQGSVVLDFAAGQGAERNPAERALSVAQASLPPEGTARPAAASPAHPAAPARGLLPGSLDIRL